MSFLTDMSFRRGIGMLLIAVAVLVSGTWAAIKVTTDHLLYQNATTTARDWARYLANNATDIEQIAAGEQPSVASMAFFESTRKAGQVFRYVIFNREGYSQLVSDRDKIALVDLSEYSTDAATAIKTGQPIVDIEQSTSPELPAFFAKAFVPVVVDDRPVAIVAAYVDQTLQRDQFYNSFLKAAVFLCVLITMSFGTPAIAWYRRTREKQEADRRIRYMAHHDALTGLTNRAHLNEKLESSLAVLPLLKSALAVYFIDIDRFKEVNDTFGHDGGDFLLKTIGQRLRAVTRADDVVARLGGDEFVVVQSDVRGKTVAEDFAHRLVSAVAAPTWFKEQEIVPGITVGVAMAPEDGQTLDRLLKSADLALYDGKKSGRNCIRFFTPEMDEALQTRLRLERIIRDAAAKEGFELHYQPVFEVAGSRLVGFEALARLPAPDGSLIQPEMFIPLAEEMRLIDKIGAWVLGEACRTATTWPKDLTVAVNLSPEQFNAGSVSDVVAAALSSSGLEPHRLELEITETLLLGHNDSTMAELRKLKAMGVAVVMDDFGTGYSSLSYLWKFPFDKIKIDRSFMQGFDRSSRDAETVVKTIIALGRELKMRVTVEGVETSNQVDFLYDADADQVQGFFFGRPVPASEIPSELLAGLQQRVAQPTKESQSGRQARLATKA